SPGSALSPKPSARVLGATRSPRLFARYRAAPILVLASRPGANAEEAFAAWRIARVRSAGRRHGPNGYRWSLAALLATARRLRRVWPLVSGSPALPDGSAYPRPVWPRWQAGRGGSGGAPIGTAILSYFTLPNSNHERKSSPIEKIIFVRSKFPSPCLKSHRSKFAAGRPEPNSPGRSIRQALRWLRAFRSSRGSA